MATAKKLSNVDDSESCASCSNKYNRIRHSFCLCKHCSTPLCMDCMKEHHEEVLQDLAQIPHEYNELKELLQKKQKMIAYINELLETQKKIILDIEKAKEDAQSYVLKIDSDLRTLGIEIEGLTKQSIVQSMKMSNLMTELKSIEQLINIYQAIRTEKLLKIKPGFSIDFDCPPVVSEDVPQSLPIETIKLPLTNSKELSSEISSLNALQQPDTLQDFVCQVQQIDSSHNHNDDSNRKYENTKTTYTINRMASDGKNVMYTSYYDEGSDLITYRCMNSVDRYKHWKQSRIDDMIWWNNIAKFICATKDGNYAVDSIKEMFKITCIIRGKCSYCRVAANADNLFIWINRTENKFYGVEVYSNQFECIRPIDFNRRPVEYFIRNIVSFCVTDNLVASICTRMQNYRETFLVTFCDFQMNKLNSIALGECDGFIEIRTDGKDRFFITTGRRRFYIIHSNGKKQIINLNSDGDCIAILHNGRVAISKQRKSMEIITY
ncbi:unnamed protein product [Rotaria sp. Silwood2]|nr:unnamed protein product [Rotaria sp. Silwood2]